MTSLRYWCHLLAIAIGVFLGLVFAQLAGEAQQLVSSVGHVSPLVDDALGQCPGYVIASGPLDAAAHELNDGSVTIGGITLLAVNPAAQPGWYRLMEQRGQVVDLVIRPVTPRQKLERLER